MATNTGNVSTRIFSIPIQRHVRKEGRDDASLWRASSAGKKFSSKKYPVLRNWASIAQSVRIFSMSQSGDGVEATLISPFRIHGASFSPGM